MTIAIAKYTDDISRDWTPFINLGDIHAGHKAFAEALFVSVMAEIYKERSFALIGGDIFDMVTKSSKGNIREQTNDANYWLDWMTEKLSPLAQAGLLCGVMDGNHDDRIYLEAGFSIVKQLAYNLKVPYFEYEACIVIQSGYANYVIYATHGSRGCGNKPGASSNAVDDLKRMFHGADIHFYQHTHYKGLECSSVFYPVLNVKNLHVAEKPVYDIKAGSFQKRSRYAKQKCLTGKPLGAPVVYLKQVKTKAGYIDDLKKIKVMVS